MKIQRKPNKDDPKGKELYKVRTSYVNVLIREVKIEI